MSKYQILEHIEFNIIKGRRRVFKVRLHQRYFDFKRDLKFSLSRFNVENRKRDEDKETFKSRLKSR